MQSLLLILLSVFLSCQAYGRSFRMPSDPTKVDFSLVTIGMGKEISMRWGHIIVRMQDQESGMDVGFNWGIFDFAEPDFAWKYFRGVLNYTVGAWNFRSIVRNYIEYEDRSIIEDKLLLNDEQKRIILHRIAWWLQPENRLYAYNMRWKNCSTIVRDIIDEAVQGKIRTQLGDKVSDLKFRRYAIDAALDVPYLYLALDIVLNSTTDQLTTEWDLMARPYIVREILLKYQPSLLGESKVIYESPTKYEAPFNNYFWWGLLLVPLALCVMQVLRKRFTMSWQRLYAFLLLVVGLLGLGFGVSMTLSWIFSDHVELPHNANLWLFWPTDFLLIFAVWKSSRFTRAYMMAHIIGAVLFVLLYAIGVIQQNVFMICLFVVPIVLLANGIPILKCWLTEKTV